MVLDTLKSYGVGFQTQVISALLTRKEFLHNIIDILNPDDFDNKAHKWIVKNVISYFEKYHTNPSMEVLKVEVKKVENEVLCLAITEQLREAYRASENDLKYVEEEFSTFCKNQQLKKALLSSVDLLNSGEYDSIRGLINNALKAGEDRYVGQEYSKEVESRYRPDSRVVVPTPWESINKLLQGGLGGGDLGLFFGNPGGGKSWCLVALGAHAARLGYNVVHYTLELDEIYVGKRYDAYLTGIPLNELKYYKDKIKQANEELKGEVVIREYPPKRASLYTIEANIRHCTDKGIKPDLIIIDYLDLLSSRTKSKERKDEIDDIYVGAKGLAKELKLPIWSVSQVNREGAKNDIIEGTSAAGSYDKIMIGDVLISLSRKRQDKLDGTGRFHIMKNRYGEDGLTYSGKVDTSTGHMEIEGELEIPSGSSTTSSSNISKSDKAQLAEKFFDLKLDS